jgi:hypothetical protein
MNRAGPPHHGMIGIKVSQDDDFHRRGNSQAYPAVMTALAGRSALCVKVSNPFKNAVTPF